MTTKAVFSMSMVKIKSGKIDNLLHKKTSKQNYKFILVQQGSGKLYYGYQGDIFNVDCENDIRKC